MTETLPSKAPARIQAEGKACVSSLSGRAEGHGKNLASACPRPLAAGFARGGIVPRDPPAFQVLRTEGTHLAFALRVHTGWVSEAPRLGTGAREGGTGENPGSVKSPSHQLCSEDRQVLSGSRDLLDQGTPARS